MLNQLLFTVGAGVASAVFFFIPVKGSALALFLGVLAPLPLLIVALGNGLRSVVVAAMIGAALIAMVLTPWLSLTFLGFIATPAIVVAWFALTARPEAGLRACLGAIVGVTVAADCVAVVVAGLSYDSFDAAVADLSARFVPLVEALFSQLESLPAGFNAGDFARVLVYALAPFMAVWGVFTLAVNLWLAGRVAHLSARLPRPWPDIPRELGLSPRAGFALAVFLGFALAVPGVWRIFAATVAAGIAAALSLQGLAVLHFRTRGAPGRGGILFALYTATLVVFPWPLALTTALGLVDLFHPLRKSKPVPPANT